MTELLNTIRDELRARLDELEPLVREHHQLTAALTSLQTQTHDQATPPQQNPGPKPTPTPPATSRHDQRILAAIRRSPGLRTDQLTTPTNLSAQQASNTLKRLQASGQIEQLCGGWYTTRQP